MMHRRYDPSNTSSETYSPLSESQPVTRASSTTAVTTPDEVFSQKRYGRNPSSARSSKYLESISTDRNVNGTVCDVEPYGPYFSLPPDPTSDAPPLVRRPTAKELIGRYESMTGPGKSPGDASSLEFPKRSPTTKADTSEKKPKGRSPIRQSLRNLLSVFNKKGKLGKDNTPLILSSEESSGIAIELKKPSPLRIHTASDLSLVKQGPRTPACTTPLALYSGQLLHLCHPETQDAFPVWTQCSVVLHPSHILITWHTGRGNPSTSIISFEQCTDVRSLGLGELDPTERTLLPSDPDDLRPFELLFEGRAREKFAATSVKERAGWVSAIWDAVLKTNEERTYTPSLRNPHSVLSSNRDTSPHPTPEPIPTRPSSIARNSYTTDRELPAVPEPSPPPRSPARFELYDPPVPKHTSPSSTPTKSAFLEVSPISRSQSPSIRNLDQRSVVKQRLAQIERTASIKANQSSPEKSTRSRQIVGSASSPTPTRPSLSVRTTNLSRINTVASVGGESIIDSYANNDSPLSMYSGRLTSIPSGRSLQNQESPTPKSAAQIHLNSEWLSPASKYSVQAPSLKPPAPPVDRLSGAGQTRSMFIHPPANTETIIPRASQLRMTIEQEARISGLQEQLASVQQGLERLPQEVEAMVGDRAEPQAASGSPSTATNDANRVLRDIDGSVRRIEDQGDRNAQCLTGIHAKVDALMGLHSQLAMAGPEGSLGTLDISTIAGKLEEVRAGLRNDLPLLARKLEELMATVPFESGGEIKMNNLPPSKREASNPEDSASIHSKLDNLLAIYQAQDQHPVQTVHEDGAKVQEVLELLKGDQAQRTQQMEQQADNARYLNELNTWLETFVAHGTSQIDTVVAGVQQLCKELGPVSELNQPIGPDGRHVSQASSSLLSDVRRLLIEHNERGDGAMLQESVNGLMVAIQEDLRRNAETQNAFTTESIVALVERQRQDQEQMLRTLASELSNDIRGERLRFVEAMKEATTINVQIHVEEFKKELTREVLSMTQEVARLHRERQTLEQHIADLFAFYAKQKQNVAKPPQQQQRRPRQPQDPYPQLAERGPSSRGRPLPNPIPRGMPGG